MAHVPKLLQNAKPFVNIICGNGLRREHAREKPRRQIGGGGGARHLTAFAARIGTVVGHGIEATSNRSRLKETTA